MKIRNKKTGEIRETTIKEAAEIAQLDVDEVRWAIEENGRCDTDEHAIGETEDAIQGEWEDEQEDPDRPRTTPAMPTPTGRVFFSVYCDAKDSQTIKDTLGAMAQKTGIDIDWDIDDELDEENDD
jgi:hypothetical protein